MYEPPGRAHSVHLMRRRMRQACTSVVPTIVLITAMTGCGQNRDCPAVGEANTLTVETTADLPPGATIQLDCEATDSCMAVEYLEGTEPQPYSFIMPEPVPKDATITVLDANRDVISAHSVAIRWEPPDDVCGTARHATVTIDPSI